MGEAVAALLKLGRIGSHGLLQGEHGLEHLVVNLHQGSGLVQGLGALSGDEHDGVAAEVDLTADGHQHPLVPLQVAHLQLTGQVGGGDNLHHAGHLQGLADVDTFNNGTGVVGAHCAAVDHALHADVIGVLGGADGLGRRVHTGQILADLAGEGLMGRLGALTEHLGGQQNRVLNLLVAGAAADIVAQGELDLIPGGIGVGVDEALGAHDHAGGAEAALHRAAVGEGVGVHILLPVGEALAGDHPLALHFGGLLDAGLGGLAVNQNHAGAARSFGASVLNRGEPQLLPQEGEQALVPLCGNGLPVDDEGIHGKKPPYCNRVFPRVPLPLFI